MRDASSSARLGVLSQQLQAKPVPSQLPPELEIEELARRAWPSLREVATAAHAEGGCGSCGCGGSCSSGSDEGASRQPAMPLVVQHRQPLKPRLIPTAVASGGGKLPKIHTAEDYIASVRNRNLKVYLFGELVKEPVDHPIIWPSVNAMAETYRLGVEAPELGAAETFSGFRASRFLHIAESAQDLVRQSHMQRELGRRTGTCFQRCVGQDALNSSWSTTYDIDKKYGTNYHERFKRFVAHMQENNFVVGGAMTDPKGDRSRSPSQQIDPDLFTRVHERRPDGSVVLRGAKLHQTGTINSHWMIVMPGQRLEPADKDYAILCAVPVTAPGITYIYGRQSCDLRAMEGGEIDQGNAKFGGQETTVIFEDVVVPAEHVFMDGEVDFAQLLVERFTAYHRRSYICKAGLGDVLVGAAATISEYQGTAKASHIRDKLVEMVYLNENIAGTALAASSGGHATPSGNYLPDVLLANVCKHNVTRFPYEIARLSQDLAGGLLVTLPSDKDFKHDVAGPLLDKLLATKKGVTVENRRRILRLIENMTMGRNAVGYLTESLHGAGSPQAQRVLIQRLANLSDKMELAKRLAGVAE
eukprot:TRINITY_DN22113_c0_g1_i1.p1 TRINITY_DN22113_c0_g1~~TRINITY_DN22113_c0_g1_i1.p1  ORF type:complete len:611 (+),score=151.48 TRINITY_DN22113_c0_g1_i1:78-1835(+)